MVRKLYLLLLTILLMVSSVPVFASEKEAASQQHLLQDLDRLSQEALKLTEQGQFEEAKQRLDALAQRFTQINFHNRMSIEALELASNSMVQGKQAYTETNPDKNEALWHATQIRILIDALTHPNQPIWKGYHMTYLEQVGKMLHHSERKEIEDLSNALHEHYQLYTILKPAKYSTN